MYERVVREATQIDDWRSYLNEGVLYLVWRSRRTSWIRSIRASRASP